MSLPGDCEELVPAVIPVAPPHPAIITYANGAEVNLGAALSPGYIEYFCILYPF